LGEKRFLLSTHKKANKPSYISKINPLKEFILISAQEIVPLDESF
jgi:hypothetical protein